MQTELDRPVVVSIGGSAVVNEQDANLLDPEFEAFLRKLARFHLIQQRKFPPVVGPVGGGGLADEMIGEAMAAAIADEAVLDQFGLEATIINADRVVYCLKELDVPAVIYSPGQTLTPGKFYIGGTKNEKGETGKTTDMVAVNIAMQLGVKRLLNISREPGIHPIRNKQVITGEIIPAMSIQEYIAMMMEITDMKHIPRKRAPFELMAAQRAQHEDIAIGCVGLDLRSCVAFLHADDLTHPPKHFRGTVLHP